MFINKDSIMINNVSMGQYLLSAKYEYNKLWAEDTGRNMAGKTTGTLLGIVPKFRLTFRELTQTELETLNDLYKQTQFILLILLSFLFSISFRSICGCS